MSTENAKIVDLEKIAADYKQAAAKLKRRIIICAGTGCVANGSLDVRDALKEALAKTGADVTIELKKEENHTSPSPVARDSASGGRCFTLSRKIFFTPRSKSPTFPKLLRKPCSRER